MSYLKTEAPRQGLHAILAGAARLVPFGLSFICIAVCDTPLVALDGASCQQLSYSFLWIAERFWAPPGLGVRCNHLSSLVSPTCQVSGPISCQTHESILGLSCLERRHTR